MVTSKTTKGPQLHYYIKEWIQHLDMSDDEVATKMGLASRTSVWKLYTEQHRLRPQTVLRLAAALDRHPNELLFPPEVPSLDVAAEGATPEQRSAMVLDIMRRMKKTG